MLKSSIETNRSTGMLAPGVATEKQLAEMGMPINVKTRISFDAKKVMQAEKKSRKQVLTRVGAYVRQVTRRLIRFRKNPNKSSLPGSSPFYHAHRSAGGLNLRNSILFQVSSSSVVIGPVVKKWKDIGGLHEFGGTKTVDAVNKERLSRKYKVGDLGPVSKGKYKRPKSAGNYGNLPKDPRDGSEVVIVKIQSKTQAEHATRLNRRIVKTHYTKKSTATYPSRPFMGPGLKKSQPFLAKLWGSSIKA